MSKRGRGPGQRTGKKTKVVDVFVGRPFQGLSDEAQWVAMREIVPSATAPMRLSADPDREVLLCTVLPAGMPALVKPDGRIFLALQADARSGDVNRDLAQALERATDTEPGHGVAVGGLPGAGPRLGDLLVDARLDVSLHADFDFWMQGNEGELPEEVSESLQRANDAVIPTAAMKAAEAAYWCQMPGRAHLRWVLPHGEDDSLDALARLYAEDQLSLGPDTRYAGSFRAHGLLVPVWDLPRQSPASDWESALATLAARLQTAIDESAPLDPAQRKAREGLRLRQITLR